MKKAVEVEKTELAKLITKYNKRIRTMVEKSFDPGREKDKVTPVIDEPVLVGVLKRTFGWNSFKESEPGTPVYHFKEQYYFEIIPLAGGKPIKQTFNKTTLTPYINFNV
jgi:hypothetical protein